MWCLTFAGILAPAVRIAPHPLSVLPVVGSPRPGYPAAMDIDLRPCPFCGGRNLTIARASDGRITTVAVVCMECAATGPKAKGNDSLAHVSGVWNRRRGTEH